MSCFTFKIINYDYVCPVLPLPVLSVGSVNFCQHCPWSTLTMTMDDVFCARSYYC